MRGIFSSVTVKISRREDFFFTSDPAVGAEEQGKVWLIGRKNVLKQKAETNSTKNNKSHEKVFGVIKSEHASMRR